MLAILFLRIVSCTRGTATSSAYLILNRAVAGENGTFGVKIDPLVLVGIAVPRGWALNPRAFRVKVKLHRYP